MKLRTILFAFLFFAFFQSIAGNELRIRESMVMHSRILNQDVNFSVCLPANYFDVEQSFPVVYLLHGLGDDETSWLEYGRISQYADKEIEKGEIVPMIFIIPDGYRTYYVNDYTGTFMYQDMFVNELVPYIDSIFRTVADKQHRATMGYSMGGFGALILHLKYPDVFGVSVPLSISVRTNEQYIIEEAPEWDEQWGKLFGAPGLKGAERLTQYYQRNTPFYLFEQMTPAEISKLNIYMDVGDKEHTLCRSNEELHILMKNKHIPHEYRVRDGGHSFSYWCSALPNALHYLSDTFESLPYRGDVIVNSNVTILPENQFETVVIGDEIIGVFTPKEYAVTDRLYPVLYLAGNFTQLEQKKISASVNQEIENNEACPMLIVFLTGNTADQLKNLIPAIEERLRIRQGYRFRAIAFFQQNGLDTFSSALTLEKFRTFILADAFFTKDEAINILSEKNRNKFEHISLFIEAPEDGIFYEGNGNLHMIMRDLDLKHEYRVREGNGGFDWFLSELSQITALVSNNFHK